MPAMKETDMKTIVIRTGDHQMLVAVRETEDPATWELEWAGVAEGRHARLMLKTAENIVLRNGGERIVLTCGAEQEAMVAELGKRPEPTVSREGARFAIQLIAPAEDGLIHDDDDFRTPLRRITCPTCVGRIAKSRTQRREDAFGKREGPKAIAEHSRQIAEAYTRLAEIAEALEDRRNSETLQK